MRKEQLMKKSIGYVIVFFYIATIDCVLNEDISAFKEKQNRLIGYTITACAKGDLSQPMLARMVIKAAQAQTTDELALTLAKIDCLTCLWHAYRKKPIETTHVHSAYFEKLCVAESLADLKTTHQELSKEIFKIEMAMQGIDIDDLL